jgi:Cd2+/Zn2+-exporting ATPase
MEAADIVLMQDRIGMLSHAIGIARKTRTRIVENVALSLVLKLIFLGLAIPGLATLWMAVLADVGTTLIVTLNGMRILRERAAPLT